MDSELPGYSAAPSSTAAGPSSDQTGSLQGHSSSLQDSKGFQWLTLTVNSRAPASTSLPVFYEGDVISGHVDFDVLKSESIKGISIKVGLRPRHGCKRSLLMRALGLSRDDPRRSRGTAVPQCRDRSMDAFHVLARRLESDQVHQGKIFLALLPYPPLRGRTARSKDDEKVFPSHLVL